MLTYWKITFTIAAIAVLIGALDRYTRVGFKHAFNWSAVAFFVFLINGIFVEVWG